MSIDSVGDKIVTGHHCGPIMTDRTLEQFDQAMRGIFDAALKLKPP